MRAAADPSQRLLALLGKTSGAVTPQRFVSPLGKAHLETSASSLAKCMIGCCLRHWVFRANSSTLPVCARATPSKLVMAAPRSRVSARNTARFSSATSARSSWSTIASLSVIEASVSSCAVSSRPNGSRSPYGICMSFASGAAGSAHSSPHALAVAAVATVAASATAAGSDACSESEVLSATRKLWSKPLASLELGSAAWDMMAEITPLLAWKSISSNLLSPFTGTAPVTFTSRASQPVAAATASEKRSAKSMGKGELTLNLPWADGGVFLATFAAALSKVFSMAFSFCMIDA
mmetsp:Transcript_53932/g.175406  ORF Transcript_53932/g.175406 Transcript_53932/m.175406 type:complete len:293 (+) Transcript_53932:106-984(+)